MKPILFNGEMVQALLEGRKTVTRRLIKPQPVCYGPNLAFDAHDGDFFLSAEKKHLRCRMCGHDPEYSREGRETTHHWKPPYESGDILYVRETWAKMADVGPVSDAGYVYRADFTESELQELARKHFRWHPSLHMPKEAARIFLRVKRVRVERLLDITEEEAHREGCTDFAGYPCLDFMFLWNSTIKKTDIPIFGWAANPWVWVIEFELISKEACT